jgi:NRPS condensation-like uncharacterized protein
VGVPFNVVDETIRVLDRRHEPWTVQVEAWAAGPLDVDRVRKAVRAALARHPMARARQTPWSLAQWSLVWEVPGKPDVDPLRVVRARDDEALSHSRAQLYSDAIPPLESPPLRVRLVRHPEGDGILLCVSHAAADGLGSLRILASIVRAYCGASDPVPEVDPLAMRELQASFSARGLPARGQALARFLAELGRGKARIASDGGARRDGYGFHHERLSADETAALEAGRTQGSTVNDYLVAALHLAIAEWNAEHGCPAARIGTMVPVNLRPPDRRHEIVGNFSSFVSVVTTPADRAEPARALAAVAAQTRRIRQGDGREAMIDFLSGVVRPPAWFRQLLAVSLRPGLERGFDTAVLSNLGRLDAPPTFGPAVGEATALWFSPPAPLPLGLAIGAVTTAGRLHLVLRYRHPVLGPAAARRFASGYRAALTRFAS